MSGWKDYTAYSTGREGEQKITTLEFNTSELNIRITHGDSYTLGRWILTIDPRVHWKDLQLEPGASAEDAQRKALEVTLQMLENSRDAIVDELKK